MSVGTRLKEERSRLGHSQTEFASFAGAKKGTQISWEKDASSPNAQALVAFAEAGADVLYILTGRRTFDLPGTVVPYVEAQLTEIRRELLTQAYPRLPGEDADQAEKRCLQWHANTLSNILRDDLQLAPRELADEVASVLEIVTDPAALARYRVREFNAQRQKINDVQEQLDVWLIDFPYQPGAGVRHLLVMLAVDFSIPIKRLIELLHDMHAEAQYREEAEGDGSNSVAR